MRLTGRGFIGRGLLREWLLLFVLCGFPPLAAALEGSVSLEEVVKSSDVIVVGTLEETKCRSDGEAILGCGNIHIERVIEGDAKSVSVLPIYWSFDPICHTKKRLLDDYAHQRKVWVLSRSVDPVYKQWVNDFYPEVNAGTFYSGTFYEMGELPDVEKALSTALVSLAMTDYWSASGDLIIRIRNASGKTIVLPRMDVVDGKLALGPGARLECYYYDQQGNQTRSQLRVTSATLPGPRFAVPGDEQEVRIPKRSLFVPEPGRAYYFTLYVDGFSNSNRATLFISDRAREKWWGEAKEAWWLPARFYNKLVWTR